MNDSGWVKLWRKSLKSGLPQNLELWGFFCWCLLQATHQPCKVMVGYQEVHLKPGQFIFGRKKAAQEFGISESKAKRLINSLKSTNRLTVQATNKFSIITIVNWDTYQVPESESDQQSDRQSDQRATGKRPASDHKQECKEHKNVKNKSPNGDSSPNSHSGTASAPPECPHKKIIAIYHEELPELPAVQVWGDASRSNLKARWREDSARQSPEWWRWFFCEYIRPSDFLMGRVKEWQASLDWIVRPRNFQKIMNGLYVNKGGGLSQKRRETARELYNFIENGGDE